MEVTDQRTSEEKNNIVILGESMINHVNGYQVSKKIVKSSLETCQGLKLGACKNT